MLNAGWGSGCSLVCSRTLFRLGAVGSVWSARDERSVYNAFEVVRSRGRDLEERNV